jgi:glycosyltransferase involved in cell wall biosynthesis
LRILILTQYFPPETGAPQNRLGALAAWLHKEGYQLEVLTGMPNYPSLQLFPGYDNKNEFTESHSGYPIHRVPLYLKGKGFISRIRTYLSFCFNAWRYSKGKWQKGDFDWVFCESPPLFLGITAKAIAASTGARFWFNVSDLWPESVEKLGLVTNPVLLWPFYRMERWLYQKANFITGQTQGICASIQERTGKNCFWYPNGITTAEVYTNTNSAIPQEIELLLQHKVILYSGNFGYAQGLEVVIHAADLLRNQEDLIFILIGDGPEKEKLQSLISGMSLSNAHIFSSVSRSTLFSIIKKCFATVVPLRGIDLFRGAIPSKIFEPLALSVPVLLGVKGEAQEIFCNQSGAALFFEPENASSLRDAIIALIHEPSMAYAMAESGKVLINGQFNRETIHRNLLQNLQATSC